MQTDTYGKHTAACWARDGGVLAQGEGGAAGAAHIESSRTPAGPHALKTGMTCRNARGWPSGLNRPPGTRARGVRWLFSRRFGEAVGAAYAPGMRHQRHRCSNGLGQATCHPVGEGGQVPWPAQQREPGGGADNSVGAARRNRGKGARCAVPWRRGAKREAVCKRAVARHARSTTSPQTSANRRTSQHRICSGSSSHSHGHGHHPSPRLCDAPQGSGRRGAGQGRPRQHGQRGGEEIGWRVTKPLADSWADLPPHVATLRRHSTWLIT